MSWTPTNLLHDGPAHPVALDALLLREFGPAYWGWEPETIWVELKRKFLASPPESNRDCIQTVRALHSNDRVMQDWFLFEKLVMGLNNIPVVFDQGQPPTTGQVLAAMDAVRLLRPLPPSEEVGMYVAAVIRTDGVYPVPPILSFCSKWVIKKPANSNADDDLEYRAERLKLMRDQLKSILRWAGDL